MLCFFVIFFYTVAGHYFHMEYKCRFEGEDLDLVETYHHCVYDKVVVIRFNRSTAIFTGYTRWTSEIADAWNRDDRGPNGLIQVLDGICRNALALNKHLKNQISNVFSSTYFIL